MDRFDLATGKNNLKELPPEEPPKEIPLYVISQGEYSDYGIVGIFSDRGMAECFINAFKSEGSYDEMRIEENYVLNPFEPQLRSGVKSYLVRMKIDGTVLECEHINSNRATSSDDDKFDVDGNLIQSVFAMDEQHAIKIVNEKRTQIIAMNQWPENSPR